MPECKHTQDGIHCDHRGYRHAQTIEEIQEHLQKHGVYDPDGDRIEGVEKWSEGVAVRLSGYDETFKYPIGKVLVPDETVPDEEESAAIASILGRRADLVTIDVNDDQQVTLLATAFASTDPDQELTARVKEALQLFKKP